MSFSTPWGSRNQQPDYLYKSLVYGGQGFVQNQLRYLGELITKNQCTAPRGCQTTLCMEFRPIFLLDWLPLKAIGPSLSYYLCLGWREKGGFIPFPSVSECNVFEWGLILALQFLNPTPYPVLLSALCACICFNTSPRRIKDMHFFFFFCWSWILQSSLFRVCV